MLDEIAKQWIVAKQAEAEATDHRRHLEDMMISALNLAEDFTGTQTHTTGSVVVRVSGRINQTVDGDKLQEIAMEHGVSDHLATLFRWKPEVNAKAWKACDDSITRPLLLAVTSKPGRPTFSIQLKETKE